MKQRRRRSIFTPFVVGLGMLALTSAVIASTASGSVPSSRAGSMQQASPPGLLAPTECSGVGVTAIVNGVSGGNASELLLGTTGTDKMDGAKGNDCVMGGAGDDTVSGGNGTDVCIGGPGTDTFNPSCEVTYQ